MKKFVCVLAALAVVIASAGVVVAQSARALDARDQAGVRELQLVEQQRLDAAKLELAQQIIQTREDLQQRGAFDPGFKTYWTKRLKSLTLAQLESVSQQISSIGLEESIASATGSTLVAADTGILSLGDSSADLLYTKVTPCRVADTRVAGGILGTGATRTFYIAGTSGFTAQGGTACGIPLGPATAVAMNVTIVGASGPGWLRAYPYGGSGNASIINYSSGQTIANGLVMPICDPATTSCAKDLTVVADSYGGHVLIDVMGYWAKPTSLGKFDTLVSENFKSTSMTMLSTCGNYLSTSITVPVSGKILLTAHAMIDTYHTNGTEEYYYFGINTTATNCSFTLGEGTKLYNPYGNPTGYNAVADTVFNVYYVSAGTYTYYLNGYKAYSTYAGASWWFAGMTAVFYPY